MSDMAQTAEQVVAGDAMLRASQQRAAELLASKAGAATSAAEAKDFAQASLLLSQAMVILDPAVDQQGVPLEHEFEMEERRQSGLERLERAKAAAAAPQSKKRLKIGRDTNGRMADVEETVG